MSSRLVAVLLGLAGALVGVLAGTRTWAVTEGVPVVGDVAVGGREAAPLVIAVALAAAAGAVALGTAGRVARPVIGVLLLLAGLAMVWTAITTGRDPADASAPALSRATGTTAEWDLSPARSTAWPWVAAGGGALTAAAGALTLGTFRSWPAGGRRFERQAAGPAAEGDPGAGLGAGSGAGQGERTGPDRDDPAALWDSLSRGDDPS